MWSKEILRLLVSITSDPFATAYPPLLQAAVRATQVVMMSAWPRVTFHQGEILKILTACWLKIHEEEVQTPELGEVKSIIKGCIMLLTPVLKLTNDDNFKMPYRICIDSDGELKELLVE